MRRLATAVPTVVMTVAALLTLSAGTALAHGRTEGRSRPAAPHTAVHHGGDHRDVGKHRGGRSGNRELVTLTGLVSDTATAVIDPTSDTATATITIVVKGGERTAHNTTVTLTLDRNTVIRRGDGSASAADLRKGDHVSVRARRLTGVGWLALRINASPSRERE